MSEKKSELFLTPAVGLRVIDPATSAPLPPSGALVSGNEIYWQRRLNAGEVTAGRRNDKPAIKQETTR